MGLRSLQGNRLTAGVTFATGSGFLLFGYDQGVFGGLIENRSFQETFDYPSSMMVGHITATYDLGCFLGAIACMALGDYFGRRLSIALGCFILTVGAVLQASSYHSAQMIVGRFVAGVGNGINTTSIPVWQSEMSKPRHRGRLIVLQLALNQLGNVTAQWLNFGLGFIDHSSVSLRFPLAFQIFYALLAASATPWLPDSPRWLIQRNREPEARVVLARLYNKASTPDDPEITALHEASVRSVQHELELTAAINWRVLFRKDRLHTTRRILLGAGTQFMQQWGGNNVINYYLPVVFASLNISRALSLVLSCCNSMNLMFSTCGGAIFIDSIGRKNLMLAGALFQGISFAFVGGSLGAHTDQWSKVAMAFVFMFFTVFGLTWIAVPWMYPAEVNTQQWRNWGAGIATATNWICNYAVVLATPVGIERIAWRYYLIYAALNILFIPIVWVFYVETGGLSLEEVDEVFEKMGSSAVDGQVEKDGALSEWVEHVRA
ncbi:sugar porter family MFS transporter [Aspergillus alliaceus]|uniref:sugar porter family MFS transporter n=1 Tax=Petromyces alliaceus TaxID=209559 RepID=UPI0012A56EDA|nr:general substrate transporter [Aspergillus alliaceus]KAB8239023.1 general substrate transporter [Aspergillus alliaceus]